MFLSKSDFSQVTKNTPLISIDLCILNGREILLGKRNNSPAKNLFFVPGGRILKSELKINAFKRILKNELGFGIKNNEFEIIKFLGIYEHFYNDNFQDNDDFTTHYVVLAYLIPYKALEKIKRKVVKEQHSQYIWFDIDNDKSKYYEIHNYTLDYFQNPLIKDFKN